MDRPRLSVSPGFFMLLALLILVIPLPWIFASVLAAIFHELCHWLVMQLLCAGRSSVRVGISGARMQLPSLGRWKELLCTLAGPIGGLSLLLLSRWMPRTAFCAALQSMYNLLPIYPLDGGRAAQCILSMGFAPPVAERISNVLAWICRIGLLLLSVYACLILKLGLLPMLLTLLILIRTK